MGECKAEPQARDHRRPDGRARGAGGMSAVAAVAGAGPRAVAWRNPPALLISALAVLFAIACGMGLVLAMGVSIGDAVAAFAEGAWGSPYAIAASINRALALGLVGLGFVLPSAPTSPTSAARARSRSAASPPP